MATAKRITERVAAPLTGSKVDREKGVIDGVLLCGTTSENGRDYPPAVFRRDFAVYEGRVVNCDHAREATVDRRLGWFTDVKPDAADGRPRGRLNLLKSHPLYERVMEAAERNPALFGFSHVAYCDTTTVGGREVVEAIRSVESIDLVAEPATTKGLFESKGGGVNTTTVKKLLEAIAARTSVDNILRLKRLAEMDGMADVAVPEPAADADPDDAIDSAFAGAMHAQVDAFIGGKLDLPGLLAKLKELAKAHGNVSASDDDGEGEGEGDGKSEEGKKKKKAAGPDGAAVLEALAVAEKVGLKPDAADLQLLAGTPAAAREGVAKKLLKAARFDEGTPPTSAGVHGAAKLEGKGQTQTPPADEWEWN